MPSHAVKQEREWLRQYTAPLVGAKITAVEVKTEDDDFPENWIVISVQTPGGRKFDLEVGRDEEGNGPGFLFGLPSPLRADDKVKS